MSITEGEKQLVIEKIGSLEDTTRLIVLASLDAFSEWLESALYSIYVKIRDALGRLWQWIVDQFA